MRSLFLLLCFFFLTPLSAQAAHKDTWKGRIAALKLFRSDIISSIAVLEGEARKNEYRRICKMRPRKSAYLPTCEYKDWTGEDNRSVPSKAGEFFEIRCRNKYKEPLSCTVSGWSKGFVAGHPSNSASDPMGAVEDFRFACEERKYPAACTHLGDMYAAGVGVEQDGTKAKSLYDEACKANDSYGCYRVGQLYLKGLGVELNQLKAFRLFEQGCKQDHMQACVDLADLYERGIGVAKDASYSLSLQEKACKGNHGEACYNVARLNLSGVGNLSEQVASIMYDNLCGRGDHRSCFSLANLYAKGRGFEKNVEQATELLEKTCDDRYIPACAQLAEFKLDASNPFSDPAAGVELLQSSCKADDPSACVQLASLLETGSYVSFNPQMAVDLYMNTCGKKQGLGCRAMGRLYEEGTLIKKNIRLSKVYYEKGCETLFDGGSCAELGVLYLKGSLPGGNAEGIKLLAKGCDLNYEGSCRLLGDIYRKGTYVAKNFSRAYDLYSTACNFNDDNSCLLAAQLIVEDKVENKLLKDALPLFERACSGDKKEACEQVKPIWFKHKFGRMIEKGMNSKRCVVSTFNEEDPAANKLLAKISGRSFRVLKGDNKGEYEALPQGLSFEEDPNGTRAFSYWSLIEKKGKQHHFTHQEYWDTNAIPDPARGFPAETTNILVKKKEVLSYNRDDELISLGSKCEPILKSQKLDARNCTEIQAVLAAQLITNCSK